MSWFSTNAFLFELPGDGWVEDTLHLFRSEKDPSAAFVISRTGAPAKGMVEGLMALPKVANATDEIVRHPPRYFGSADAEDVSVLTHNGAVGQYFRMVGIPCHGRELTFQWGGLLAARAEIDARAEKTLDSIRFYPKS